MTRGYKRFLRMVLQPVASIPPSLESKLGASSPLLQFWAEVPLISDSSFPLHFGLFPL